MMPALAPARIQDRLAEPGAVLLDDREHGRTFLLHRPVGHITADTPAQVEEALAKLDAALADGLVASGFLSYEAGVALNRPNAIPHTHDLPLVWLGLYEGVEEADPACFEFDASAASGRGVENPRLCVGAREYCRAVERIKAYIEAGDVYQVNYTCKVRFKYEGPPADLFLRLRSAHPVGYSGFLNLGYAQVLSLSPELLLRREGRRVLTRPMKGTAKRGRWSEEDQLIADALARDEKNRAENLMILDLMRNDLGRVCEYGSVTVPAMFQVERYPTVLQMTSEVEGLLYEGVRVSDLLRAILPPGSVTGTPKLRACEIIGELEAEARGPYCGCIGIFRPNGDCLLNVAIRTVVKQGARCELGVGGAIVADSTAVSEREEAISKSRFLFSRRVEFDLLETLRYDRGRGYRWTEEHLARMAASAGYFDRRWDAERVIEALEGAASGVEADLSAIGAKAARVRLLVGADGEPRVEWAALVGGETRPVTLMLAEERTDPDDVFLYHKTTHRALYDLGLREAQQRGHFDALFLNARGEVTECSRANIVALLDGEWVTPPLACGLLPGLWREEWLRRGPAIERVITLPDLLRAERVVIGNSVRGAIPVASLELGQGRVVEWQRAAEESDGAGEVAWTRLPGSR
ncbi:MAG: aminodeoxychorismate synthase, component I [Fimbriimonadales bacterium]